MLEHCSTLELLSAIIDTFSRHAVIWASMDVKGIIIAALDTVYHSLRSRSIQSISLLTLLIEFDGGRYLNDISREEVRTDLAKVTHVRELLVFSSFRSIDTELGSSTGSCVSS